MLLTATKMDGMARPWNTIYMYIYSLERYNKLEGRLSNANKIVVCTFPGHRRPSKGMSGAFEYNSFCQKAFPSLPPFSDSP
jgi:hypothetical protein